MKKEETTLENFEEENNNVKIAGKGDEIYDETILRKLNKFDQIVVSALDAHLEKAEHIINKWTAVGILPYTDKHRIKWDKREQEIEFEKYGTKVKKMVNFITLTKTEELFKFTKYG